jgi:hypothetical protein
MHSQPAAKSVTAFANAKAAPLFAAADVNYTLKYYVVKSI